MYLLPHYTGAITSIFQIMESKEPRSLSSSCFPTAKHSLLFFSKYKVKLICISSGKTHQWSPQA